MFSATDWALKRVLKFVLKKSVGRFLHSEPDLEQLDVQLSSGTFELRNVLLNCQAVNEQLVSGSTCCGAQT
jgi:autophagy-related protein 2